MCFSPLKSKRSRTLAITIYGGNFCSFLKSMEWKMKTKMNMISWNWLGGLLSYRIMHSLISRHLFKSMHHYQLQMTRSRWHLRDLRDYYSRLSIQGWSLQRHAEYTRMKDELRDFTSAKWFVLRKFTGHLYLHHVFCSFLIGNYINLNLANKVLSLLMTFHCNLFNQFKMEIANIDDLQ